MFSGMSSVCPSVVCPLTCFAWRDITVLSRAEFTPSGNPVHKNVGLLLYEYPPPRPDCLQPTRTVVIILSLLNCSLVSVLRRYCGSLFQIVSARFPSPLSCVTNVCTRCLFYSFMQRIDR